MFSLRQALTLPGLKEARVVAGATGLERVVRRVHVVVEVAAGLSGEPDALVLTTGQGLPQDAGEQRALVTGLAAAGLAGIALLMGWHLEQIPESFAQAAQEAGFPLLELPRGTDLGRVVEQLAAALLPAQSALERRSQELQRQLTQIVLTGGELPAVATALASFLERSVLIENTAFEVLAAAQHGPIDEARRQMVELGRSSADRVALFLAQGIYRELQQQMGPLRMSARPAAGLTMERVAAPIVAGGEIYGYIWIVAGDRPLTGLDELAIEGAATVSALLLLKEQAVREARQSQRGDLLDQLLSLTANPLSTLVEQANQAGYRLDRAHQVVFVQLPDEHRGARGYLAPQFEDWLGRQLHAPLVVVRERGIAAIIETPDQQLGVRLAQGLLNDLQPGVPDVYIGVSQINAAGQPLRRGYDQAVVAAEIGRRLRLERRVCPAWELGLLEWLYHLAPERLADNPYYLQIDQLARHDQRHRHDLLRSLEAYLDCGGALAEAALRLNIHRNTLAYRLNRVTELLGVDLREVEQRLNLHVAIKCYRVQLAALA